MSIELTPETTHDEIQAYVDQVVADVSADRAGEKSDAQTIAEERDTVTASDDDSGSSDQSGETESPSSWIDDDVKAEVAAYGISETDLAEFANREELDRAMRLFDRTALEAGRKAMVDGTETEGKQDGPVRDESGRFAKPPEEKQSAKDGRYEIGLDRNLFDDDLVNELERMRDHYEDRIAALESRFAVDAASAEEQRFDSFVDALGHPKLFGKTGAETPEQLKRRQDLIVACKAQQIGLEQLGRKTELDESLVSRVARMVFASELSREEQKALTRKISKQSNSRMGGSPTKPTEPAESLREWARREYKQRENH
jgi:hypothetical protein